MSRFFRIAGVLCCLGMLLQTDMAVALDQTVLEGWGPLKVHFDNNQTDLSDADKAKIRELLRRYDLGRAGRVFVVGYTDSTGSRRYNDGLSRKRAQQVRQTIIAEFNLSPEKIIAIGKGAACPLADNHKKEGRALNRRAEIYLSKAVNRDLRDRYQQDDPHLESIDTLIDLARQQIRQDDLPAAWISLKKARAAGGDRYSQWHGLYAIAGFYADAPLQKIKAHLQTALRLDADNLEARAFLGRVEAREKVAAGLVTAASGRSAAAAIAVTCMDQQYEYLNLFKVEPLYHHQLEGAAIDVWECRDLQQQPVAYYFDRSPTYAPPFGAFSGQAVRYPNPAASQTGIGPLQAAPGDPQPPAVQPPAAPQRIWRSELFR